MNDLSQPMLRALQRSLARGAVYAGSDVELNGRIVRTSASTLRGLERRGLVTIETSPDGGIMARPTAKALTEQVGDCFEANGRLAVKFGLVLVHGIATLQRLPFARFVHAWCESVASEMAIDYSNGCEIIVPRALYYAAGKIDPEQTVRYTPSEVTELTARTGEWGPWHELSEGVL